MRSLVPLETGEKGGTVFKTPYLRSRGVMETKAHSLGYAGGHDQSKVGVDYYHSSRRAPTKTNSFSFSHNPYRQIADSSMSKAMQPLSMTPLPLHISLFENPLRQVNFGYKKEECAYLLPRRFQ